jgi:hypothetical protein
MQLNTAERNVLHRYWSGTIHEQVGASRDADSIIRRYAAERGSDYGTAHRELRQAVKTAAAEAHAKTYGHKSNTSAHDAGVELDAVAKDLMQARGYSYTQAMKAAILANPRLGESYTGRPIRRDGFAEVYADELEFEVPIPKGSTPWKVLAELVVVKKKVSGEWDSEAALLEAARFPKLVRAAARQWLEALKSRMSIDDEAVRIKYPALARIANGQKIDMDGLRELLPQYFSGDKYKPVTGVGQGF